MGAHTAIDKTHCSFRMSSSFFFLPLARLSFLEAIPNSYRNNVMRSGMKNRAAKRAKRVEFMFPPSWFTSAKKPARKKNGAQCDLWQRRMWNVCIQRIFSRMNITEKKFIPQLFLSSSPPSTRPRPRRGEKKTIEKQFVLWLELSADGFYFGFFRWEMSGVHLFCVQLQLTLQSFRS